MFNVCLNTQALAAMLITRYDWMRDEPNDHHSQNCLTFLKDQDIFGYFVWHWNDWDCEATAGYICEFDL